MKLTELRQTARGMAQIWRTISRRIGWQRSFREQKPVDAQGEPLPWYTYGAIEFLRSLDLSDARVFEYGCGYSSIFWTRIARSVVAVEHDKQWAAIVTGFGIANLEVRYAGAKEDYVSAPLQAGGSFDIVIVDGRHRRECAAVALQAVAENGIIVFDNADWYREACADLRRAGWFEVDFSGFGPINPYCWTTAMFVRADIRFAHHDLIRPMGGLLQDGAAQ